jgi:hypothetical protein
MTAAAVHPGLSHTAAAANGAASPGPPLVGLRTRYPEVLSALREGWWQNPSHLETLSALAVWRQSIDDGGRDPREELSFQIQLANYGKLLQQQSGGILDRWKPGAPPVEWS